MQWSLADARAQTPIETRVRLPLVDAGIGPLVTQYAISQAGILIAEIDLALPHDAVAVEADGREDHEDERGFVWDRRRDVLLAEAGWEVVRFSWEDALRPAYVVRTVRRAIDRQRRRALAG